LKEHDLLKSIFRAKGNTCTNVEKHEDMISGGSWDIFWNCTMIKNFLNEKPIEDIYLLHVK